jgi:hypothetical protein
MFPVYGRKCLSRKEFQNWVKKFSQERSKIADDARSGAEVSETTVERLVGQVYQCWWRICGAIFLFFIFEYHMFNVLYPFVTYIQTPSQIPVFRPWIIIQMRLPVLTRRDF